MELCQILDSPFKLSHSSSSVKRSSVKHCLLFVPPACLAPLGCSLSYLSPCCQFIDSSINGCEKFKILLILFFLKLHDFSVFVPILYIVLFSCTSWRDYIYYAVSCHLPDITLMIGYHLAPVYITWQLMWYHLTPDMLLLDTCFLLWHDLSPASWHINTWPVITTFMNPAVLSCITYSDLNL